MKRAVFIDRDGVVNRVCYHDEKGIYSATSMKEFKVLPGVRGAIKRFKSAGFLVIVITNQPGIAFGYIKKEDVDEINGFMQSELGVDAVYSCYHHPEFTGGCDCRKPGDGLLKTAAGDFGIDISRSFMIGDNLSDIEAGGKCRATFLVVKKKTVELLNLIEEKGIRPTHITKSMEEAADIIFTTYI